MSKILYSTALLLSLCFTARTQPVIEWLGDYYNNGVWDAAIAGSYAYAACGEQGLRILNVSNLSSPMEAGAWDTPGFAHAVKVVGNYAYVADMEGSGVRIIDIITPGSPNEVSYCLTPGQCFSLEVVGDYLYVADGKKGLQVVNIANPFYPYIAASLELDGDALGIGALSQYAYVVSYLQGLQVVDISNPQIPVKVGHCQWPDILGYYPRLSRNVALEGNYAYVADYGCGMRVVDISDPANPVSVSYLNQGLSNVYDIAVVGNFAYLAQEFGGLKMVSIVNPLNPLVSTGFITGPAVGITMQQDLALVCLVSKLSFFRIYTAGRDNIGGGK